MKKLFLAGFLLIGCGQGSQGPAGLNGTSCSMTPISGTGALIQCTDGTQSMIVNGTVVQPVQFCPGTTTYPSEFNEIGFCIQNVLYAVYSTNGGFMTEIPVGYYGSDGINASCNFTVGPNCTITH